ncbi:MAG: isopentenyl phosphate kinase family protein [Thermoplasmatales archaeon]|nr:isopentenyl phosphate kinase family protein [Thermoplasmatales archaeon]
MILVKLGGSVITDKSEYRTFDAPGVAMLCREIKDSGKDVIVVHGAGSFGHIIAKEHGLADGYKDKSQIPAVAEVCRDVRELNGMVVSELISAGIPAVGVPPGSCFMMDDGVLSLGDAEVLRRFVDLGIMPVMFGDVVLDRKQGFGICSGDQVMERLCDLFPTESVVFVSDVDGLYSTNPKEDPDAVMYGVVTEDLLGNVESAMYVADVTGGVAGKMRSMLRMCAPGRDCHMINGKVPGRLLSLLRGEEVISTKAIGGD